MGLANRAVILTITRIANYGLMLVSPIVLVRLFSVEAFGQYREFLLYGGILQTVAVFAIPDSLLYFIAAHPDCPWRVVKRSAVLTLCTTSAVVLLLLIGNAVARGALVGPYLWPLAAYTLFSVNLDFWEFFWVARRRPIAVFVYSAGRLTARLAVVVGTALLTRNIWIMIWALVALEGVRLAISAGVLFTLSSRDREPKLEAPWSDFLRFCLPFGAAGGLALLSRSLSSLAVTKMLGAAALAQYSIGRFGEPIVTTVRNSISAVVLPEMVRRERSTRERPLVLWRQAIVVNAICLFPIAVIVARYAVPLVTRVFGANYVPAAAVMQLYMIVVFRECFDFGPALRAVARTSPLVASTVASLIACGILLIALVPREGLKGAMGAYAGGSLVEATCLAWATLRVYDIGLRDLLPWGSLARVVIACGIASLALLDVPFGGVPVLISVAAAATLYLIVFGLVLFALRVPEAFILLDWARRMVGRLAVRGA